MFEPITHHPLFGLLLTLLAFRAGQILYQKTRHNPFAQPVVVGMTLVIVVLVVIELPYEVYFDSAYLLHLLLGPVTVALAIPLYQNLKRIRALLLPIISTLILGSLLTVGVCLLLAWLLGASETTLMAMTTKSITTPIAMAVAEKIGATAALAAPFVMFTGVLGAVIGPIILDRLNIKDDSVKGVSLGLTSHAVGTARALEISEECGAFAALSMGLTGILTAIILPFLL